MPPSGEIAAFHAKQRSELSGSRRDSVCGGVVSAASDAPRRSAAGGPAIRRVAPLRLGTDAMRR